MWGKYIVAFLIVVVAYIYLKLYLQAHLAYPEISYTVEQHVHAHGLQFESHTVQTRDGYLLELQRLSLSDINATKGPPVLLMHGFLESAAFFVISGADSIAITLARQGHDVWLGNARGNCYSRKHITLDVDNDRKEFFNFSLHEIGSNDIPAMIDYILAKTHFPKVSYVGHSQGNLVFYVMLSERPEYNDKLQVMIALAPVVFTRKIFSPTFATFARLEAIVQFGSGLIGMHQLFPPNSILKNIGNAFCTDGQWTQMLCDAHLGVTGGFNSAHFNKTLLPTVWAHFPCGAAVKQFIHYTQIYNAGQFRKYDHGLKDNLEIYGQETPPLYSLRRTTIKVALFYGPNDWLTSEEDISTLHKSLPNVILNHRIADESFTHFDFFLATNVKQVLYPKMTTILDTHGLPRI